MPSLRVNRANIPMERSKPMSIEINTGNSAQNAQKLSQAMFESLSKTSGSDAT